MSTSYQENMIARYPFNDASNIGKDISGNHNDAMPMGSNAPIITAVDGRNAVSLSGGPNGSSYLELPKDIFSKINDNTGITIATWVNYNPSGNVWERIIDCGKGQTGPYLFLTRELRGVCFNGEDIVSDPVKTNPAGEWRHIAMTVTPTKSGTVGNAGPMIYINGEVAHDGKISQTTSGLYGKLREWFSTLENPDNYCCNYIGRSQYQADGDFFGSFSDFRIYADALSSDEIIDIMCEALTEEEIIRLARDKYLSFPTKIVTEDIPLPTTMMGDKVQVRWTSSDPEAFSNDGKIQPISDATGVTLTATLTMGNSSTSKSFRISVVPAHIPPYTLTIHGGKKILDISDTLYGLFFEDINNSADGGIYAELVMNRSFEAFTYHVYDPRSGENGVSSGRNRTPLAGWFGDIDKLTVCSTGGLNEFFGIDDEDNNSHYVTAADGAVITNRGFSDRNNLCSMFIRQGESYDFTVWAKTEGEGSIDIQLKDAQGNPISDKATITVSGNTWAKYGVDNKVSITGTATVLGQLELTFHGEISVDMISLFPQNVWGADQEPSSQTAHANYTNNSNYRLRRDMVQILADLHPTFLRFPGGCISEGSWIWENVYDWKDSVGPVETRKENFNVWGYDMTMGLGYFEYFQLAEDLNATPLPVMACGVLCQARSNYANPCCGALRDKYIKNFTDLIDFAINTDTENNKWAKLRKEMGHEAPFDLHYLGIGNENWEPKFMANFEIFYKEVKDYLKKHYPDYPMEIISTVGPQADDNAYKECWKFIAGGNTGTAQIAFSDGKESHTETVTWYENQPNYMDTIADEHYYRPNHYMLNNADRYNYYYRAYNPDGSIKENEISKVFVGEYASNDKNTLAGAISEAAIMTGFEKNSDVVRLAAYAPLFNKVLTDGTYRWTPDLIWFDDETVWRTPNYYVQQLYAKYLGTELLETSFSTYYDGIKMNLTPKGGIEIATRNADVLIKRVTVTSNDTNIVLLDTDFTNGMPDGFALIPGSGEVTFIRSGKESGMLLTNNNGTMSGIYNINTNWTNYTVTVKAIKLAGNDGFFVGAGVTDIKTDSKNCLEYAIALDSDTTGLKVFKQGIEGYTLGDFATSKCAGNLRDACYEPISCNKEYTITFNYGGSCGKNLVCSYTDGTTVSKVLDYKLEAYNSDIYHSVTKNDNQVFVKLVNADMEAKQTKCIFDSLKVASSIKTITLSGDAALLHVPNVNQKNDEKIMPVESTVECTGNECTITLPANSVTILVMDLV